MTSTITVELSLLPFVAGFSRRAQTGLNCSVHANCSHAGLNAEAGCVTADHDQDHTCTRRDF